MKRDDEIGPWSKIKLDILREYASAYTTILSKQPDIKRFIYIDAFAGSGRHRLRSTGEFIEGSPANALNVIPSFDEFHFIDLSPQRVQQLEELSRDRSNVHVYQGDCNQILLRDVLPRCRYEDFARGLCLLDPYGLHVDWSVLHKAGRMKSVEIFYNFMVMDANMNVLWRNPDRVPSQHIARMNAAWGDESWRAAAYTRTPGLFGDIEEKASNERLAEAFRRRLHEVAGFQYVPEPVAMRNSTGAVVYYLYFASPNKNGKKIVVDIFRKYSR